MAILETKLSVQFSKDKYNDVWELSACLRGKESEENKSINVNKLLIIFIANIH